MTVEHALGRARGSELRVEHPARRPGNVADLVRHAAERAPQRPALIFGGSSLAWAELDERVDLASAALLERGLAAGDRVALQLGNTPEFAVTYFATLRAGLVAVPANPGFPAAEMRHLLADSGARVLITGRAGAALGRSLRDELPGLAHLLPEELERAAPVPPPPGPGAGAGGEDLAVLIYTSGTSGRPRAAMLTHRALLANLEQCARIDPPVVGPDDVLLLVLPLFHIYGLNPGLGMLAWAGATGVLVERFDPAETLSLIARHGVTTVLGAPPMYVGWSLLPELGECFASVHLAMSGAAALPPAAQRRLLEATGRHVFEGYGLTETGPVLTSTLRSEVAKPASIGRPIPGVELRLVDRHGETAEEDDPGEIVVRGPNLFSGYWPDGAGGPDDDGWFATGDIAYADDDGDLHLLDRRRDLILVSGFNVYPREVEMVLTAHPAVEEAAVLGLPHPYTGKSVKALVVLAPGARLGSEEVIAHCEASLARFKCPTSVEFVTSLPHSPTGKVSKARLREASSEDSTESGNGAGR